MTIINGANHHNVEDILASIRTSIADEHGPARLIASEMQLPARRETHVSEETSEFELPAIFKPGHSMAQEKPKLFGRLSDALKTTNASDQPRSRTVIPFDPSVAGRMLEPPAETAMQARQENPGPAAQPAAQPDADVKRVMPTFFDTRINRLGELTREVYAPKEEPKPEPAPAQTASQPPALPEMSGQNHAQNHGMEAVDDAAAQLLRPMLRQWLQENMPKIVEKALLSEVQGNPMPKPRK